MGLIRQKGVFLLSLMQKEVNMIWPYILTGSIMIMGIYWSLPHAKR